MCVCLPLVKIVSEYVVYHQRMIDSCFLRFCMYLHESSPVWFLVAKIVSVGSAVNNRNCSTRSTSRSSVPRQLASGAQ